MISALTNYLQNQPLPSSDTSVGAAPVTDSQAAENADSATNDALYAPSQRALMVSAVASDYDVTSLTSEQTSGLQQRLQQYGLIGGTDLNAFAVINTARADMNEESTLNAVELLDGAMDQFSERGASYSERQQITRLHTLMHNIASARPLQ